MASSPADAEMGDSSPEQMQEENNGVAAGATTDGGSSGDAAPIESVHFPGAAGIPVKPALAHKSKKKNGSPKKSSNKKSDRHLKWDEAKIREHDKERGTRMKIEEPNTPFNHAYDSGNETDGSASSARNNSKTQISWDALTNKLEAHAAVTDAYPSSPSSYGGDMSEHEHEERDKERKKMEFEEHRKRHYNEMELVRRFRAQHPDEDDDDEDDDADDEKE